MNYCVGFVFAAHTHVLLCEKRKPDWQAGLWNGVGGKIEPGEAPDQAMAREFGEETGWPLRSWSYFAELSFPSTGSVMHCYTSFVGERRAQVKTVNDVGEPLKWWPVRDASQSGMVIGNLRWLLPLALDHHVQTPVHVAEDFRG